MIRLPRALAAAAAALVLACSDKGGTLPPPPPGLTLTPVTITGDAGSSLGVLDPSLAYAAGAGSGGLAYSSVPSQSSVHTRVAQSSDGGATWAFLADVNVASARTITTTDMAVCGAATCTGTWVHEVPTLVVDSTDPDASRRYKVFNHSYFVTSGGTLEYAYGVISLYTAPALGGPWSAETRLLGWDSPSTASDSGVGQNITHDPALTGVSNCVLLTEPGAQTRGTTIDLAVGCVWFTGTKFPIDIRLLRSTDHGATWSYVTTLVDTAGANFLGSDRAQINGADLFTAGGKYYLLADPHGTGGAYVGCVELEFTNIASGALLQLMGGPDPRRLYQALVGVGWTPCTAAPGATQTGVLMGVANLSVSPPLRIVATNQGPP